MRAIGKNHPQTRILFALRRIKVLAFFSHIGSLTTEDKPLPRLHGGIPHEGSGHPNARFELALHLLKQRLEALEVLATLALGNFLSLSLLGNAANMTEVLDIRSILTVDQLSQQFIIRH
ncbi:hypothetical protein FQZ97_837370 [compost metagenome]